MIRWKRTILVQIELDFRIIKYQLAIMLQKK